MSMIKQLLTVPTGWEAVVTGRRYRGPDAVEAGFVDRAVELDQLLAAAAEIGLPHASTAGENLGRIKAQVHAGVLAALAS